MKKIFMRLFGIVLIIGIVGFLVWSYVSTRDYVSTTATVIAVEFDPTVIPDDDGVTEDYIVTFEYTVDGQNYQAQYNAAESEYKVNDKVEISYDPDNPNNTAKGRMSFPILIAIAAAAIIIGILSIIKA